MVAIVIVAVLVLVGLCALYLRARNRMAHAAYEEYARTAGFRGK